MDLESSTFCGLKVVCLKDLLVHESVHLMDLELSTFYGLKVVHFKDLKTCPCIRSSYGLRVVYFFVDLRSSTYCELKTCR